MIDENRQFFCSELVAKIFKVCNIMEDDGSASSNYLPCHFTTSQWTVPLKKGIKIGDEK